MIALKIVTGILLLGYGARIVEAFCLYGRADLLPLLPYIGAWASWIALASWQIKGLPNWEDHHE